MIHRLLIDNYRCFVNFECRPSDFQLILGDNGAGKTTLFDILVTLREFLVRGVSTKDAFPTNTLTAWDKRAVQTFELALKGNGGDYQYRLVIEHERESQRNRIKSEELQFDRRPLYQYDGSDSHLFRDDGSSGPVFPFDWSRSFIPTIPERRDNQCLTWFRNRMNRVYVFSPDPVRMKASSEAELIHPDQRLHDLASWLRHLVQQRADFGADVLAALRDAIDGLVDIRLHSSDSSRVFQLAFQLAGDHGESPRNPFWLTFDQLSDGQRNLVALYIILLAAVDKETTLCFDEPDNFVALREIQPWVTQLQDRVQERSGQCLLISHHPELINYLAARHGLVVFRDESGPARAKPFEWTEGDALPPAELVARGWR